MAEIFPVRSAIEEVAARLATVQLAGDGEALRRHLNAMEKAAADGDRHEQVLSDVEFHRTIVDACGNSILRDVWQSLRVEGRTMITSLKAGIGLAEIVAIHEPILDAIIARDPDAAAIAMRQHFDVLRSLLDEEYL